SLALGLLDGSQPGHATISDAEEVNRVAKQRMLSHRIDKRYPMRDTVTRADVAVVQLDQTIAALETNSQLLLEYAPTAPIRAALSEASETWQRYREAVLTSPNKERALHVLQLSEQALEQNEKLVKLIEPHTGNQVAQLVNRSGRPR